MTSASDRVFWNKAIRRMVSQRTSGVNKYTHDTLLLRAADYFQWASDNPIKQAKQYHYQGAIVNSTIDKPRPFTLRGLALYLGVTTGTLKKYRDREELSDAMAFIEDIIHTQKFEGAVADTMNATIIVRDLGLADRRDHSSQDGTMSPKGLDHFYAGMAVEEGEEGA